MIDPGGKDGPYGSASKLGGKGSREQIIRRVMSVM